jgi:hypothetical protein
MPKKLTSEDKQQILQLYRQSEETTSTLASRYEVSNSTISRFLKTNLPEAEYELLIQQKRSHRYSGDDREVNDLKDSSQDDLLDDGRVNSRELGFSTIVLPNILPRERLPTRKPRVVTPPTLKTNNWQDLAINDLLVVPISNDLQIFLQEELQEELLDVQDDLQEDLTDDWGEVDDEEEEDFDDITLAGDFPYARGEKVQVLPLSVQELPRVCYLVVDRSAELIAKPLKDFSDLGQIPSTEVQEKTLPVFDHHKVAQRFSNRFQKVIKVPDGQMLHKTRFHLHAKGIACLLINGQVYSLV